MKPLSNRDWDPNSIGVQDFGDGYGVWTYTIHTTLIDFREKKAHLAIDGWNLIGPTWSAADELEHQMIARAND